MRVPRKLKKKIPEGPYCYILTGKTSRVWNEEYQTNVTSYHTKTCPLYFWNKLGYGDCRLLVRDDDKMNGEDDLDMCLDDQCKSCGIKRRYE